MKPDLKNTVVSCFADYEAPWNPKPVKLMTWLTSDKYADKVGQIRTVEDKKERDAIKGTLPAITPSGRFRYRNNEPENLIKHSGFIQFDVDLKGNEHITNYTDLKSQLCNFDEVAYCSLSASGRGYWGMIPIAYPERHEAQFWALYNAFKSVGLTIDIRPREVHSLRGYSYDSDAYFNFDAKVFTGLADDPRNSAKPARKVKRTHYNNDTHSDVESLIEKIQSQRIDITTELDNWLRLGYAFAGEFQDSGRDYFHTVSQYHPNYTERETDRIFNACLRSNRDKVNIDSFFYLAKQYGVLLYECNGKHTPKKDKSSPSKFDAPYPESWDKIELPAPGSPEDYESARAVVNDAEPDELQELMKDDPVLREVVEMVDCELAQN